MSKEFDKHLEAFLLEARSHIEVMNHGLLKLEKSPDNKKYLHDIFRSVHTLKSMAATMNYLQIAKLCHVIENLFEAIKNEEIGISICVDDLFKTFDFLSGSLKNIDKNHEEQDTTPLIKNIERIMTEKRNHDHKKNQDPLRLQNNEIEKVQSIGVKIDRLDTLLNLVEEMIVCKMKLENLRDTLENSELTSTVEMVSRVINELQYNVMQIRMVSINFVFNQFPRMVRDLAKQQGKEINFIMHGGEIELDRTIIDAISESLVHLIRNAIDHGLETTEDRLKENKPVIGEIRLTATRSKESVIIEVCDDGRGLNFEAIKNAAIKSGQLGTEIREDNLNDYIFSGLSTKEEITDVSGRGLGLNIVKQKIESIDGLIRVESKPNVGTSFFIEIPLSLAVLKTLFVKVGPEIYAIPVMNIQRLVMVHEQDIKWMLDAEAIILNGEEIPVLRLKSLFLEATDKLIKEPIVIVQRSGRKLGLAVDELLTIEEVVVKPLNRFLKENKYFSGSAIIGSGEIVLILDVAHFLQKKMESSEILQ